MSAPNADLRARERRLARQRRLALLSLRRAERATSHQDLSSTTDLTAPTGVAR